MDYEKKLLRAVALFILLPLAVISTVVDPDNFSQSQQWQGVAQCTKIVFGPAGEVFCGEKVGRVRMFPSITASANDFKVIWDGSAETYYWHDRGLLGLAIHPNYPQEPFLFAFYSVNRGVDITQNEPIFPDPSQCPDSTGYCNAAARLVRIRVDTQALVGTTDQILMSDWCAGSGSHHTGDIVWAPDDGLYLASGDGAAFSRFVDLGVPDTLCFNENDPRDQGSFRSQWDEYLHGKMIHIPLTSLSQNRLLGPGDYRIVAKGLRNPYRFSVHPVNGDLFIGDVGWDLWEEIDRLPNPLTTTDVVNFGWPCYEGPILQPKFGTRPYCQTFTDHTPPFLSYSRQIGVPTAEAADKCSRSNVSPAGFAFREGDAWGSEWENRLFWTDSSLRCIFYFENTNGIPDSSKLHTLVYSEDPPQGEVTYSGQFVDLRFGTGAQSRELYVLDYSPSTIAKIRFTGEITIDASKPNYAIENCALLVDNFEGSDQSKNQVPAPASAETTCSTGSSNMKVQVKSGSLRLQASSSKSFYSTDFAFGDTCFSAAEFGFNFLQFDVKGNVGSLDVALRIKNGDCNSETDASRTVAARLWGGFNNSGTSTVSIPLKEFGADLSRLQGIKLFNLFPLDEEIEIDNIRLLQSCGISVPKVQPTLCSIVLDDFSSNSALNAFGGSVDVSDSISVSESAGTLTLSTGDTSAIYSSIVHTDYCVDFSFYDKLEITYSGASFAVSLGSREKDCSTTSTDATLKSSPATVLPKHSKLEAVTIPLSSDVASNVFSVIFSGITGELKVTKVLFVAKTCNLGKSSSGSDLLVILVSSICGGLLILGLAAFFLRRRRILRHSPRNAKNPRSNPKFFEPSSPASRDIRSRPASVRNREGVLA